MRRTRRTPGHQVVILSRLGDTPEWSLCHCVIVMEKADAGQVPTMAAFDALSATVDAKADASGTLFASIPLE